MMNMGYEVPLILNSTKGDVNSSSSNFTIRYNPFLVLDPTKEYEVGLDSISSYYTWHNVSERYENNKLKYTWDNGKTWKEITLANGSYDYEMLSIAIHNAIKRDGHSKTIVDPVEKNKYTDEVSIDYVDFLIKCKITLLPGYQLDLRGSNFNELIGFKEEIVNVTKVGENIPNITNSVDEICFMFVVK